MNTNRNVDRERVIQYCCVANSGRTNISLNTIRSDRVLQNKDLTLFKQASMKISSQTTNYFKRNCQKKFQYLNNFLKRQKRVN